MIAEIYGKLSSSGSNLSETLEDNLTGNVFGTLRYIPPQDVLLPFLCRAYAISNGQVTTLDLPISVASCEIDFWITEYGGVEPDLRIRLCSGGDMPSTVILVEVKYESGLSGEDQLIRQIRALREHHPNVRKVQVFLTKDHFYPTYIMESTQEAMLKDGISDIELYWLSWHDISAVLDVACGREQDKYRSYILADLIRLCVGRKGFERYSRVRVPDHRHAGWSLERGWWPVLMGPGSEPLLSWNFLRQWRWGYSTTIPWCLSQEA